MIRTCTWWRRRARKRPRRSRGYHRASRTTTTTRAAGVGRGREERLEEGAREEVEELGGKQGEGAAERKVKVAGEDWRQALERAALPGTE